MVIILVLYAQQQQKRMLGGYTSSQCLQQIIDHYVQFLHPYNLFIQSVDEKCIEPRTSVTKTVLKMEKIRKQGNKAHGKPTHYFIVRRISRLYRICKSQSTKVILCSLKNSIKQAVMSPLSDTLLRAQINHEAVSKLLERRTTTPTLR